MHCGFQGNVTAMIQEKIYISKGTVRLFVCKYVTFFLIKQATFVFCIR